MSQLTLIHFNSIKESYQGGYQRYGHHNYKNYEDLNGHDQEYHGIQPYQQPSILDYVAEGSFSVIRGFSSQILQLLYTGNLTMFSLI